MPSINPSKEDKNIFYNNLYLYNAQIRSVYDGDTIRADISLGFGIYINNQKIRLLNINAPEVRGKSKESGRKSRDYLRERILGKKVIIKTHKDKQGKYGRWLAEIFINGENINNTMVKLGYAKSFMKVS
jgi:micrococcal nuclease